MMMNDTRTTEEKVNVIVENMNATVKSINDRFSVKEFAGVLELCVDEIQQMGFAELDPNKFVVDISDNAKDIV